AEGIAKDAEILQDPFRRRVDRDIMDEHVLQLRTKTLHPFREPTDQIPVIRDGRDLLQTSRDDVEEIVFIQRLEQEPFIALTQKSAQPYDVVFIEQKDEDAVRQH